MYYPMVRQESPFVVRVRSTRTRVAESWDITMRERRWI